MRGKVAVEEHFVPPGLEELISGVGWSPEDWRRVVDRLRDTERRLEEMELSLGAFGVQDLQEPARAVKLARRAPISEGDRLKIGRTNALRLLGSHL